MLRWLLSITILLCQPLLANPFLTKNNTASPSTEIDKELIIVAKFQSELDSHEYLHVLLKRVLDRTVTTYGAYEIKMANTAVSRQRVKRRLEQGLVHVYNLPTHNDWERDLLYIPIPAELGLFGFRVFLIRGSDQAKFNQMETLHELKSVKTGLSYQWSITPVFEALGFQVARTMDYKVLFKLLANGRIDSLSRGVLEVFSELRVQKSEFTNLALEKKFALYVPLPTFFFVSPKKPRLAERIKKGMSMMLEDGSLKALLLSYFGNDLAELNFHNRKLIVLDNPFLSKSSNEAAKKYRLQLSDLSTLKFK